METIAIVIAASILALLAWSGLLRLGRKRSAQRAWRVGDVLATTGPGEETIHTVVGVDAKHRVYLLARGAWPGLGAQHGVSFAELTALQPVFVRHVDIP